MRITTNEARVKTASVEVHALTISGKQVTLAVFRQLQDEQLIDLWTGKLNGVPWGRVNYFWGDCGPNHLHVVWQKGDELRRSCVYDDPRKPYGQDRKTSLQLIEEKVWVLLRQWQSHNLLETDRLKDELHNQVFKVAGREIRHRFEGGFSNDKAFLEYNSVKERRPHKETYEEARGKWLRAQPWKLDKQTPEQFEQEAERRELEYNERMVAAAAALRSELDSDYESVAEVEKAIQDEQRRAAEFVEQWQSSYSAVAKTDQLFIAV